MNKIQPYLIEMKDAYMEEIDRAVITLAETAIPDVDRDKPKESMEKLKAAGFGIKVFRLPGDEFKTYVILHSGKEFVGGSVVELSFELGVTKRDLLPYSNDLDAPFTKFIEGVLN